MFTRKTILALATFAALGTTALAPTSASAWGHGGGHFGGHFGGGHFGGHFGGHWGGGHWGGGHWGHWGGGHWGHWGGWRWNRGYAWGWRYRPGCWRFRYCGGPSYGGYGGGSGGGGDYSPQTTAYSAPASGPATSSAGCLAKGYMPDGSVVFTDRCTNEGAVAPAGDNGPPQGGPPQGGPRR